MCEDRHIEQTRVSINKLMPLHMFDLHKKVVLPCGGVKGLPSQKTAIHPYRKMKIDYYPQCIQI
jgi:hypothetical protein